MLDILTRAGSFVGVIVLGYVLRRVGFFKKEDFHFLSKLVLKITLTAAIVSSFAGQELDASMLLVCVLGFGFGLLAMLCAFLCHLGRPREERAFAVLNCAGCNIGNFVLPFAQSFLGPVGVMVVSLFDAGNSSIGLGLAYGAADTVRRGGGRFSARPILKALASSAPFLAYITMTVLCLLHVPLPGPVVQFADIIAGANAFLAMLMIGVGFELHADKGQLGALARLLGLRFALAGAAAALFWFALPWPAEYRQALVILAFSPVASTAPAFTARLGGDFGLASAVNSLSILISIVCIVTALAVLL